VTLRAFLGPIERRSRLVRGHPSVVSSSRQVYPFNEALSPAQAASFVVAYPPELSQIMQLKNHSSLDPRQLDKMTEDLLIY